MNRTIYVGIGVVVILVVFYFGRNTYQFFRQEDKFIQSQISGRILKIEDYGRGRFAITIREFRTSKLITHSLYIGKFLRENNIQGNDSICKSSNSHDIYFFKKNNGEYKLTSKLHYY